MLRCVDCLGSNPALTNLLAEKTVNNVLSREVAISIFHHPCRDLYSLDVMGGKLRVLEALKTTRSNLIIKIGGIK